MDTSVNEIDRAGGAILQVRKDHFPNEAITSARAQGVFDWVLSLARTELKPGDHNRRVVQFARAIVPNSKVDALDALLDKVGINLGGAGHERRRMLSSRRLHEAVVLHAGQLFVQGNYFHAVFEAAKAYNKAVREKAAKCQGRRSTNA